MSNIHRLEGGRNLRSRFPRIGDHNAIALGCSGEEEMGRKSQRERLDKINKINEMFGFCSYETVIPVILYILSNPGFGVTRGILSASVESGESCKPARGR